MDRRCAGRHGVCSASGQPHIVLSGRDAESGRLWTALAQPYPPSLARNLAASISAASEVNRSLRLAQLCQVCSLD